MLSIKKVKNLKNKKVLLRVDYNVPIKDGKVEDDFRIKKSVPTILYLLGKGANIHILMHLGDDGLADISPVVDHFFKITKFPKDKISFSKNIRSFPGEMENDKNFAKSLTLGYDFYVNEAFSVSHRKHASVVGVPKLLPSYVGFQMEAEIKNLSLCFKNPKHPFLFILGGVKFSTKLPLIKKFLNTADNVFIGGALLNEFLDSAGIPVGKSITDQNFRVPKAILNNKKILLPTDLLVENAGKVQNKKVEGIGADDTIIDIGTESTKLLIQKLAQTKFVLWNGPLGKYETGGDKATRQILKTIAKEKISSIIGGGDTVELVSDLKLEDKFTFVSTGGGATLEFLAKGTLPGIDALNLRKVF